MEIIYNQEQMCLLLLENNTENSLNDVIIQCAKYNQLDDLQQIIALLTTKFSHQVNMIEQLLETNKNVEQENDELCLEHSETQKTLQQQMSDKQRIIQQSNTKIQLLEQNLNEYDDKQHKLWMQFLEEKKKNEKMQRIVDNLTKDKTNLEEKNNKLWLELIEEKKKNETENKDYDMLSDVSYTN